MVVVRLDDKIDGRATTTTVRPTEVEEDGERVQGGGWWFSMRAALAKSGGSVGANGWVNV